MLWTERIESLKAGALSAIATGLTALVFCSLETVACWDTWMGELGGGHSLAQALAQEMLGFCAWENAAFGAFSFWDFSVRLAIALISGFLFGVTYRYIVRQDESTHLRSGAVLAFALVRGLARLDQRGLGSPLREWGLLQAELVLVLVLLGQSWLMFAIARWALDTGLRRGWLQSFQS